MGSIPLKEIKYLIYLVISLPSSGKAAKCIELSFATLNAIYQWKMSQWEQSALTLGSQVSSVYPAMCDIQFKAKKIYT